MDVLVEVAKLNAFEILDVACHAPVEHTLNCDETVKIRREAIGASRDGWHGEGLGTHAGGSIKNIEDAALKTLYHEFVFIFVLVPVWSHNVNDVLRDGSFTSTCHG